MRGLTFYVACVLMASVSLLRPARDTPVDPSGRVPPALPPEACVAGMRPVELTAAERRFARTFPGSISRFEGAGRQLVVKTVLRATRQLHPAADCCRAAGHAVGSETLHVDELGRGWSQFTLASGGGDMRVREQIRDGQGRSWATVSEWYWSAALRRSEGPWLSIVLLETAAQDGDPPAMPIFPGSIHE